MSIDPLLALAALGVGIVVGLTGMGGGALMTPMLVLLFGVPPLPEGPPRVQLRPLHTILLGLLGGMVVGLTSVGSGSLIIIALMVLYPTLTANELVGTDLVQAVPLVASAALGHLLFGDFRMDLTSSILVGCIPGVWFGAHLSSRAPGGLVRRALAFVLLASALKLLNVSDTITGVVLFIALFIAPVLWMLVRRRYGFPALASRKWRRRLRKLTRKAAPLPTSE